MAAPTLLELAEAGAHFGHHRSMVYPKAQSYIYTVKNNVALIDLEQTQNAIENAQGIISRFRSEGKIILFVGTKRSVRTSLKEIAESIGAPYITERWFGGTLTNFSTILANIKRMNELAEFLQTDEAGRLAKKERLGQENQLHRYQRFLQGLTALTKMPDLIVLASASEDMIAIREANQLGIPVLAITDTDINPDKIAYPIPANDDAPRAVELILRSLIEAPSLKKAVVAEKTTKAVKAPAKPKTTKKAVAKKPAAKKVAAKAKK